MVTINLLNTANQNSTMHPRTKGKSCGSNVGMCGTGDQTYHLSKGSIPSVLLPKSSHERQVDVSKAECRKDRKEKRAIKVDVEAAEKNQAIKPLPFIVADPLNENELQSTVTTVDVGIQVNTLHDLATKESIIRPIDHIIDSDEQLNTWTGLPNFELLRALEDCVLTLNPNSQQKSSISLKESILLVFIKMKLNLSYRAMATIFKLSAATISRIFGQVLPLIHSALKPAVYFQTSEEIQCNLPLVFKKAFPNVRAILDCSEIPIQLPNCTNCRIATYSHYKSTNTAKFLVAIAPSGDIMHISKAYAGKASDKQIFNDERLIEMFDSGNITLLMLGIVSLIVAVLAVKYSAYDLLLAERTRMTPGLPPYDMWGTPQPVVRLSVHIFTVLNAAEFMAGTDTKLRMKEFGPIVYREHLHHTNIEFHEHNSTLSYTAVRLAEFLEDENEPGILNQTITVPNFAALGAAAYMADSSFIVKVGFNYLHRSTEETLFITMTVWEYLWNYHSVLVNRAKDLVPFLVPIDNCGILDIVYSDFVDRYNVRIGTENNNPNFFHINLMNDRSTVPGFRVDRGDCDASIVNSTEGAVYGQHLTKESVLWYWRRTLCRKVPLHFESEVKVGHLNAYRFELRPDVYDKFGPNATAKDCYRGVPALPSGLSDLSKCFFKLPFAASNPHFYGRSELIPSNVVGLEPEKNKHGSYCIVEPVMGIPIDQCAKSQSNLILPDLKGFHEDYEKFSNMVLPLFWLQYHQKELTDEITSLLVFVVNLLPILQLVGTIFFFIVAIVLVSLAIFKWLRAQNFDFNRRSPTSPMSLLKTNAHHIVFETDAFLGKSSKVNDINS